MHTAARLRLLIPIFALANWTCPASDARASHGTSAAAAGKTIVVQNYYYALPGKADEVYRWRLHASDVRTRLGLAVGRVLRRTPVADDAAQNAGLPDVVWECEYPNSQARAAEITRLKASPEFDAVEAHMQTLIHQFRRAIFAVAPLD